MLDVNFEFVRGVLFVRLDGKVNHDSIYSVDKNLIDIISKGGLKYLVFNISNAVLEERISLFDNCNNLIKRNGGKMFICGLKNKLESVISSNYESCDRISNELNALKAINIC